MNNNTILNRFFTQSVIRDLVYNGSNDLYKKVVRRFVEEPESKNNGQIISEIYSCIGKENRNEYFYTNTLINKLLVKKHNVNTTTALSQIWVGKSKADFVMINGTGKVYEVKSELDNFERLKSQLLDYYKAFSFVTVVISVHMFEKVARILNTFGEIGEHVGIYALTDRDTISKKLSKDPIKFDGLLDHACIFKLLHKREYEEIICSYFGSLPATTPVCHYQTCLSLFRTVPILQAQELTFKQLKKRNRILKTDFERVPDELKLVVYFSDLSHNLDALERMLETNYER